jgi:cytochrome P450
MTGLLGFPTMPGFIVLSLDVGCATLALYALWHFLSRKSNRFPFPPGPIGRPIIKNLLDWPAHNGWETFVQWGHKYGLYAFLLASSAQSSCVKLGDLMHADIMGQHMIVVNSYETAVDLLQRKAAIYSGRPSLYFGGKMVGYDQATSLIVDTGSEWKEQRDMFAHHIGSQKALERFLPVSRKHTRRFLCQLLDDPGSEQLYHYVRT